MMVCEGPTPDIRVGGLEFCLSTSRHIAIAMSQRFGLVHETSGYTLVLCHIGGWCPCHIRVDGGYL